MNELTENQVQAAPAVQSGNLYSLFQTASAQLCRGEDAAGVKSVLCAIEELERMVEDDQNSTQPRVDFSLLLPAVRSLHSYLQNKDIAGIRDWFNDILCPLNDEWTRGGGN